MTSTISEGYLSVPPNATGPGILVLHAWWGLNDTIKQICNKLSDQGYVAFAPDLYEGKLAVTIGEAEDLSDALDVEQAISIVKRSLDFLSHLDHVNGHELGVIGFSLGAYFALDLSVIDPEHFQSVVIFYGTGPVDYSSSRAAYLGHFAETDEFEPQSNIDELDAALRSAGRPFKFYNYPGTGHWFFEPDRINAYHQAAANQAWDRTLAFLR